MSILLSFLWLMWAICKGNRISRETQMLKIVSKAKSTKAPKLTNEEKIKMIQMKKKDRQGKVI